jgi:lipoyl(octanoyl) transferase
LANFGLKAERRPEHTGIWIQTRKIAALGVAVRRWVTYHGFALNVDPNLSHFSGIIPCGIEASTGTVTSLKKELGSAPDLNEVSRVIAKEFERALPNHLNRV